MSQESEFAIAERHVVRGREIVARQRQIINTIRAMKGDSTDAEEVLVQFERSLAIFEQDLKDMERRARS